MPWVDDINFQLLLYPHASVTCCELSFVCCGTNTMKTFFWRCQSNQKKPKTVLNKQTRVREGPSRTVEISAFQEGLLRFG